MSRSNLNQVSPSPRLTPKLLALAVLAGLRAGSAYAQTAADTPPMPDTAGIWTLREENAKLSAAKLTDHFYTNGFWAGWMSPEGDVPDVLAGLGRVVLGAGEQRVGIGLSQEIYTPCDTSLTSPDPHDQPYAGVLTGNLTLLSDTAATRSVAVLSLGVVGPDAGGEQVQNTFHDLIGRPEARGWKAQIPNTAVAEVLGERIWRLPITTMGGLEIDALPALTAGVGDLRDYLQAGVTLRVGQGLRSDFGVPRVRPGLSGGDAFVPTRRVAWYVFAGADGQAVGYDLLLQAAPFRSGPNVTPVWDVGEVQGGFAVMFHGVRITAAYVAQTRAFDGQIGGLHQFASLSVSMRF
jgi:lipid A 3-O-deacylase